MNAVAEAQGAPSITTLDWVGMALGLLALTFPDFVKEPHLLFSLYFIEDHAEIVVAAPQCGL